MTLIYTATTCLWMFHPELGNNAKLAQLLGIDNLQPLENSSTSIPVWGTLKDPVTAESLHNVLNKCFNANR